MERDHLRKNNPELAQKQEREGNKSMRRILLITTLGVSVILGTIYLIDPNFQSSTNEFLQKVGVLKK